MTSGCATVLGFLCHKGHYRNRRQICDMIYSLDYSYSSVKVNFLNLMILLRFMDLGEHSRF